jgi:retron-type reverse transcriptase
MLDLTAAFDTVGSALSWFISYLAERQFFITVHNFKSSVCSLSQGVPQGSVLGPLLFNIYLLPLGHIIRSHGLS